MIIFLKRTIAEGIFLPFPDGKHRKSAGLIIGLQQSCSSLNILVWHEAEVGEVDAHLGGDFLLGEGL